MQKFKFEVPTSAALALSLVMSLAMPAAQAAKHPAPASDGMAVKLVPARKYKGAKLAKHKAEPIKKMPRSKPQVITVRGASIPVAVDADAKKTNVPKQKMIEKIAMPEKSVAKPTLVAANGTSHTSALDNIEQSLSAPKLSRASLKASKASDKASKAKLRKAEALAANPAQNLKTPSAKVVVQQEETPVASNQPAEKDLVDSLDRLPLETASTTAPSSQMLRTKIASPAAAASAPMFSPVVQLKNRLTTGRKYELEEIGGKNFSRKHEVVLGAKHSSGFGASLTGSVSESSFDDTTKNKQTTGDITTLLYHPGWYKADGWDVYGFGRVYFPTSDASKLTNKFHYFYYLGTNYDFGGGFRLENGITPHYYTQNEFADDDTFFLFEEELIAKYDVVPWLTIGAGPYLQVDSHERSSPGTTVEITPLIGLNFDHVYFESKMYLPVFVDGQLGGGPKNASLSQIAGEFYLKLFL